jgi:hypothetical protein
MTYRRSNHGDRTDADQANWPAAISQFLRCEEGRGQNCTVEHYSRSSGTDYYVAYPDDFVQTMATHDDSGDLQPYAIRQTFEIVFAYSQEDGTLELFAKMPTNMKVKLETLFGQIILEQDIGPQPYVRPYDLNRLKDRYFNLETDTEDGLAAAITALRLDTPEEGHIALQPSRKRPRTGRLRYGRPLPQRRDPPLGRRQNPQSDLPLPL